MASPQPLFSSKIFFRVVAVVVLSVAFGVAAFGSTAAPATSGSNLKYLSGTGANDAVEWDFFCTAGRRSGEWTKIRVPACWEQEGFGTYFYGVWKRGRTAANDDVPKEQGKYRTTFTVPAAWKGQAVRIVFAGAFTDTEVFVNGKLAGPIHQGGFYQFEYDITALLNYGGGEGTDVVAKNILEVTVSKESANISVNTAERRGDYWTFGGIFRPVWLEARPTNHIERIAIDARADGTFTAHVFRSVPPITEETKRQFPNIEEAVGGGSVSAQIYDSKNQPVGEVVSARFVKNETSVTVRGKVSAPLLWTAETPNLYRVEFTYTSDLARSVAHTYTQRFGFRTVEVRPSDGIYVNGAKIILRGVNRHSFRPETGRTLTRQQCYDDVRLMQEMNLNAVRMSHYPPDSAFLEACDELGLYVLDELAGWQGEYDTPTGARLIGELIRRDVNHPSILIWDNGNEGGWNTANDGEFAKWDPQQRNVIHPWATHDNLNTKHYPKYGDILKLCAGKDIFMPTEFMHGLYDGGAGAGLADYWKTMSASPLCAGGFVWVFADEGLVRTDEFGRIDNCGNLAPDGIVGPHHEREGSFYTIKEIWSPITLVDLPDQNGTLPADWNGVVELQNNYAFTNLSQCTFQWYATKRLRPGEVIDTSPESSTGTFIISVQAPDVAPGAKGKITLPLTSTNSPDHIVYLRALDPNGRELWKWSWFTPATARASVGDAASQAPQIFPEGPQMLVKRGALSLRFDKATGLLVSAALEGKTLPISDGPNLAAYLRDNRRYTNLTPLQNDPKFNSLTPRAQINTRTENDGSLVIEAIYPEAISANALCKITWTIPAGEGGVRLDYEYQFEGKADLLGVSFEMPERSVLSKRWLGRGPYRVYRNRLEGGVLDVYSQDYNDPIPGQTYNANGVPEFKGYFRDWRWLTLATTGGHITLENNATRGTSGNATGTPFIGLWRPRDGVPMMMEFPNTDLTFLDVIPAQGSKFDNSDKIGPQAATPTLTSKRSGSVTFRFEK